MGKIVCKIFLQVLLVRQNHYCSFAIGINEKSFIEFEIRQKNTNNKDTEIDVLQVS
jgi:hypothetical protein